MKKIISVFCFLSVSSFADSGNMWGTGGYAAERLIKTMEQVITVRSDETGQKDFSLENVYCFLGSDGVGLVYDCAIKFDKSNTFNFSGKLAKKLYNQLKETGAIETPQTEGTSVEIRDVSCSTIIKNHGTGSYLSSDCRGEVVNVRY